MSGKKVCHVAKKPSIWKHAHYIPRYFTSARCKIKMVCVVNMVYIANYRAVLPHIPVVSNEFCRQMYFISYAPAPDAKIHTIKHYYLSVSSHSWYTWMYVKLYAQIDSNFNVPMTTMLKLLMYFCTAVKIAQFALPMLFKWAMQLGQSGQQWRNTACLCNNKTSSRHFIPVLSCLWTF